MTRPTRTHDLKTWPEPFQAVLDGRKVHEIRRDDRAYMVGDVLLLREYEPHGVGWLTGREIKVRVTYLTPGGAFGLPPGVCVMSIAKELP